jgi:hypothetical protein
MPEKKTDKYEFRGWKPIKFWWEKKGSSETEIYLLSSKAMVQKYIFIFAIVFNEGIGGSPFIKSNKLNKLIIWQDAWDCIEQIIQWYLN